MDGAKIRTKRAVLIIDSDQDKAETLKAVLADGGYRVYRAGTLSEALKIAKKYKIVVALLFLGRPELGLEKLVKGLQAVERGPKIAIIVILESFSEDLVAAALKAGAADFLTLPLDPQELIRRAGAFARLDECTSDDDEADIAARPLARPKGFLAKLLPSVAQCFQTRLPTDDLLDQCYEKVERLGIGSFGEVWKVRGVVNDPPAIFVAKIPLSKKLNPKIEKEAHILKVLADHAGVPQVHEVIEVKKKKVLIQEFVEGKTLFDVIERQLEDKEVESVLIQLLDVVAYAHGLGIIHRDIKPGNVIVKPDGTIKLLDFGAAKELKDKDMSSTVTGSRPYMSPEQIMGKSQRRSDVWALGVVMYVLYTGMFPFYHEVEKVLMDMILESPPPPPSRYKPDMNPAIEAIILKCLAKDPVKRFADAGVLKAAIIDAIPDFGDRILWLY